MTTLEIIQAISNIVANTHDGAVDDKGEPIKIGLRREDGHPLYDSRVMDGFRVRFEGPYLGIVYHAEYPIKEMHQPGFENEIEQMFDKIVKFLQQEYKRHTDKSLSLKPEMEECDIQARYLNAYRSWVECYKRYHIGNIKDVERVNTKSTLKENLFRNLFEDSNFYSQY